MPERTRFRDRSEGGKRLAELLGSYADRKDVVVLGLPRGGVPVAAEVARSLRVPLDVLLGRKVGVPGREELAMGAVAGGGAEVVNTNVMEALALSRAVFDEQASVERAELRRREREFRGDLPPLDLADKIVILVDDGLATGATMRVAVHAVKSLSPSKVVVAAPTAAPETRTLLGQDADEVVTVIAPTDFRSVGLWYEQFEQISDDEVKEILQR